MNGIEIESRIKSNEIKSFSFQCDTIFLRLSNFHFELNNRNKMLQNRINKHNIENIWSMKSTRISSANKYHV